MRTLQPSCDPSSILDIPLLVVSDVGQIILYCVETNTLGKIVSEKDFQMFVII